MTTQNIFLMTMYILLLLILLISSSKLKVFNLTQCRKGKLPYKKVYLTFSWNLISPHLLIMKNIRLCIILVEKNVNQKYDKERQLKFKMTDCLPQNKSSKNL